MSDGAAEALLARRRSVRAFLPDPIPRRTVEGLIRLARTAPSGANLQPGKFHVLARSALRALSDDILAAIADKRPTVAEYSYFPEPMPAHLKARQREAGYALYSALGIARRDVPGRRAQFERNYHFFDAPVGVVITIERDMGKGCFMDLGMAVQSLMLAANAHGLGACGIGALAHYGDVVHAHLGLPADELVVCGMALGKPDLDHPVNKFRTSRLPVDEIATFAGFDDDAG